MPVVHWSTASTPPLAAAIAAAIHHAWHGPEHGASNRMLEALRQMVGPERAEQTESFALVLFRQQPRAPDGYDVPPEWAWFTICPGCQALRRTKFTIPQNGRTKLQVLRDREWMERHLEDMGWSYAQIAKHLGCTPANVIRYAEAHGLRSQRALRREEIEETARRMHLRGEGPGAIAKVLGCGVSNVRDALRRLGLANLKEGQVYFDPEWWRVRLQDRGMTLRACAREAGMKPHNASYYMAKFGLGHLTRDRKRAPAYPQLQDPVALYRLLEKHDGVYEAVAAELGCSASLVSFYARRVLNRQRKQELDLPHFKRSWWVERLDRGLTTWQMAEEAGVQEKTAREKLRVLGLLDQGYRNNAAHERAARRTA